MSEVLVGKSARAPSAARGAGVAFAVALAATLVMAGPVVRAPTVRIFGSAKTFGREDPNRDPLIVMEQFRTAQVASPYLQPLTDLPGQILARLVGPVAAYNLVVLATFPLSAAAAYLLALHVLGSPLGAMVAGLAFAFLPFHVAQAAGHPHIAQTQWLPLYLLALWRCLDRPSAFRTSLLAASAAAVVLSNFYGGLIAAVLGPVALLTYGILSPRQPREGRWGRLALTGLSLGAAAAAGLLFVQRMAPDVLRRPDTLAFPRSDLFLYSARWWSYLLPPVDHPLAGSWVRQFSAAHGLEPVSLEQQVGVGFSLLVLAVVPLWLWMRRERGSLSVRSAPVLAIVAATALVCSLSPEGRIGTCTFARPSAWLYEVAPMFRAYARFGSAVGLMVALLAGAGADCLWRGATSTGRRTVVVLLAMAALEFAPFPPWRWRDVLPTRAHRWLAKEPGPLRVLDCVPRSRASYSLAPGLFPHALSFLGEGSFEDCREPGLGPKLAALGYTHVVVRRDSAAGAWMEGRPLPEGLSPGPQLEDGIVLVVAAAPPGAFVAGFAGFDAREFSSSGALQTWRWMRESGSLRLVSARPSPSLALELELRAFPGDRSIEWGLNGRRLGELAVAAEWRPYDIPLDSLAAGENTLSLVCHGPVVTADDVRHNGDSRSLCLALGRFRVKEGR